MGSPRLREFSLARRRLRPSRPASARSFLTPRLDLMLTGFPLSTKLSLTIFISSTAIGLAPSLSGHTVVYRWLSLSKVRRHTGPEFLKIVPVTTGAAFSGYHHAPQFVRLSFPIPTIDTEGVSEPGIFWFVVNRCSPDARRDCRTRLARTKFSGANGDRDKFIFLVQLTTSTGLATLPG